MRLFRHAFLVCALIGASLSGYAADGDKPGRGEKVAVDTLPDAVKATFAKEAPDAKEVYKSTRDGKTSYRTKVTGADGKAVILTVGDDGAVVSKKEPKGKAGGDAPAPAADPAK